MAHLMRWLHITVWEKNIYVRPHLINSLDLSHTCRIEDSTAKTSFHLKPANAADISFDVAHLTLMYWVWCFNLQGDCTMHILLNRSKVFYHVSVGKCQLQCRNTAKFHYKWTPLGHEKYHLQNIASCCKAEGNKWMGVL